MGPIENEGARQVGPEAKARDMVRAADPRPGPPRHRKNAAEWVMWVFWYPATRLSRWYRGLSDGRQAALAVGIGCVLGGYLQGASLGRLFIALGILFVVLALLGTDSRNPRPRRTTAGTMMSGGTTPTTTRHSDRGSDGPV